MTDPDSGSFPAGNFHTVSDPTQARLLTEPKSKAFFKPFLAAERSASEAAAELGCGLSRVLYRIKTLLDAGLLEPTREKKRKGRAIKYYRSVHDAYFVPFVLTPYATLEERLEAQAAPIFADLIRSYADALGRSERYGNYLFRTTDGAVATTDAVPELLPSGLPVTYSDTVVRLSKEEAVQLAAALRALFEGAVARDAGARAITNQAEARAETAEAKDYFLMVAMMPLAR